MTPATVGELSISEFEQLVRAIVKQVLAEALVDADGGLILRDEVAEQVMRSVNAVREGGETYSAEEVAARLALEW